MTTTPNDPTTGLPATRRSLTWPPGRPPVDELLVREKAHTREGDALAAARRRLPMVELDGTVEVVGPDGPVPFLDLFQVRDELVVFARSASRRALAELAARTAVRRPAAPPACRPGAR